jgi:hypothetical protein
MEDKVRKVCLVLPEVTERLSHGEPTFFVRDKKSFLTVMVDGHHQIAFPHLVCAAFTGVQSQLVEERPETFFVPAYVGVRGWIGARLDTGLAWDEVASLARDAYRCVAPQTLAALVEG